MQKICKIKSKDDNIDKNTATRKEVRYELLRRDCLQSSPIKHLPLTTVKRLQRKIDDIVEWSTDNLPVEANEKVLLNKNTVYFQ